MLLALARLKKNRHERGEWLCPEKLRKEFSVFSNVLKFLLELSYINEESISISATLTKEYGSGIEHVVRQNYAIRLIFTFLLKKGTGGAPGAKDFLFRHPLYHGKYEENHDSMFVRSHEEYVLEFLRVVRESSEALNTLGACLAYATILSPVLPYFNVVDDIIDQRIC